MKSWMFASAWLTLAGITSIVQAHPRGRSCSLQLQGDINTPADDSMHCAVNASTCDHCGVCRCSLPDFSPYSLEWWYWTAHLETDEGRRYGFAEVVYAAIDLESSLPVHWADHTISDIQEQHYYFGGRETVLGLPERMANGFNFAFPNALIQGGNGYDHIHSRVQSEGRTYQVDLDLIARKTPVLQRADGLVQYYSRERMDARGALVVDGVRHQVQGTVWFDRQFGPQRVAFQNLERWTWFGVQLDDEREIVLYEVETTDWDPNYPGGVFEGTLTDRHCQTTHLGRSDFTITPLGSWTSPWMPKGWPAGVQCVYPLGWRIEVPNQGIDVVVTPFFAEQEIIVPEVAGKLVVGDRYWEGAAAVDGSVQGRAYVELNGFCPYAPFSG